MISLTARVSAETWGACTVRCPRLVALTATISKGQTSSRRDAGCCEGFGSDGFSSGTVTLRARVGNVFNEGTPWSTLRRIRRSPSSWTAAFLLTSIPAPYPHSTMSGIAHRTFMNECVVTRPCGTQMARGPSANVLLCRQNGHHGPRSFGATPANGKLAAGGTLSGDSSIDWARSDQLLVTNKLHLQTAGRASVHRLGDGISTGQGTQCGDYGPNILQTVRPYVSHDVGGADGVQYFGSAAKPMGSAPARDNCVGSRTQRSSMDSAKSIDWLLPRSRRLRVKYEGARGFLHDSIVCNRRRGNGSGVVRRLIPSDGHGDHQFSHDSAVCLDRTGAPGVGTLHDSSMTRTSRGKSSQRRVREDKLVAKMPLS